MQQQLLDSLIRSIFSNPLLNQQHDSAVIALNHSKLAFTTDSYVVKPLFFPGGDIGKLAVCGTLNDLAMSGANPLYLSCSLIIEEGFASSDLQRILLSMQHTAAAAGVQIITGDTKVVDHGKADGLYINTTGIGTINENTKIAPQSIQPGDQIIISNDIGRHGIAVMLARENLKIEHEIRSDCADVSGLVQQLLAKNISIHCLRDLTRGGLASALIELAQSSAMLFEIHEARIPIHEPVTSTCEILGFDPYYVANEGAFVVFVPASEVEPTLSILHQYELGKQAMHIGHVCDENPGLVILNTALGSSRVMEMFSGEQLPRIC